MNSRKAFVFACSISSIVVLIVIIAIIVAASTTKKQNVATESLTTEIVTTEIVIPEDYTERLIQGVRDGDFLKVKDLLAMTNDFVDNKPNDNE